MREDNYFGDETLSVLSNNLANAITRKMNIKIDSGYIIAKGEILLNIDDINVIMENPNRFISGITVLFKNGTSVDYSDIWLSDISISDLPTFIKFDGYYLNKMDIVLVESSFNYYGYGGSRVLFKNGTNVPIVNIQPDVIIKKILKN